MAGFLKMQDFQYARDDVPFAEFDVLKQFKFWQIKLVETLKAKSRDTWNKTNIFVQLWSKIKRFTENVCFRLDIDEFDAAQQGFITINREEFENMAQTLLNKVKNTVQSALFNSNLKADQIDKLLLVGGGSRMPMIKQLLRDMFPDSEHCCEEHPDEVVAIGAAYYAYNIFNEW